MEIVYGVDFAEVEIILQGTYFEGFSNYLFILGTMSSLDFDLNGIYNSPHPAYLIAMNNETLLFANNAALAANQKTPDLFFGENVAALNYPEELEHRKRLIRSDGKVTNYECKLMHWYKDEDIWRRKEVKIIADFQKVEFADVECRVAVELMVEETRRFLD